MKARLLFCFIFILLFGAETAEAAFTYTWNGGASGTWNTSANWTSSPSGGTYPGTASTDIAQFTASGTFSVTLTAAITLANINETSGTTLLTINTGGKAITVNSGIALGTNSSTLTFLGSGAVSIAAMTFQNGDFLTCGSGSDATTKVSFSSATVTLPSNSGNGIFNYGTLNLTSSILTSGSASQINNESGGTLNCTSSIIYLSGGSSSLVNSGTFNLTSSSLYLNVNPSSITNNPTGILNMNAALISFTASSNEEFYNYGTVNATTGSNAITMIAGASDNTIYNYGTFNAGSGTASVCTITLAGTRGDLNNTSAVLSGTTYDGNFTLSSGSIIKFDAGCSNCQVINDATCASCMVTLASDANSSATIYQVPSGSSCPGTFKVQRYLTGGSGYRGYRLISSPVYAGTISSNNVFSINYLQTYTYLSGSAGGGFDKTGNPTLYLYREDQTPSNSTFISGNFSSISAINNSPTYTYSAAGAGTSGTFNLPVGNGVMFFFRGNRASATVATETTLGYVPVTVTTTTTGSLNVGQVIVHDWYTPASANLNYTGSGAGTNSTVRGFNLVGNPYPSSIDWEQYNTTTTTTGIYAHNVSNTVYEFNPKTQNYDTYQVGGSFTNHGTKTIVSGEGFFVQASNSTSPQLIFNETAKTTNQNTGLNLFMASKPTIAALNNAAGDPYLRLQLALDSINTDDIYIGFNASAKNEYVLNEDAVYKPGGGKVSLSSFSADGMSLAINKLPLPKLNATVIPLKVNAYNYGTYQLNMIAVSGLPAIYEVWLMDRHAKDSLDMRHNSSYTFDMTADTNSYGAGRFQLVIRQDPALMIHLLSFAGTKTANGAQLNWKTENEENYTNFTVERSSDGGLTFNVLGGFPSSGANTYGFTDKIPPAAADMYRLKIEDLNGTITYSNIVTLMYANTINTIGSNISVYPNPAGSLINLAINSTGLTSSLSDLPAPKTVNEGPGTNQTSGTQSYTIKIINITGSVIKTATSSSNSWQANISDVSPGFYIIQVNNNSNDSIVGRSAFVKL